MKDSITPIPWSIIKAEYLAADTDCTYICARSLTFSDLWWQPKYRNLIQAEARDFLSLKAQLWTVDSQYTDDILFYHHYTTLPERLAIRLEFLAFMVEKQTQSSSLNKS